MMKDFALDYACRGWHVFPCSSVNKRPLIECDKDAAGKDIKGTGGLYKATVDPHQITEWWTKWPGAMIGVRCGKTSGVWAIDPDAPKRDGAPDGRQNWALLNLQHGKCSHTHTHLTPGGGKHLLFRWRDDRPVTNSEGDLRGKGIDVRGEGGYIIAPPSRRLDGKAYEILDPLDFFRFAEAPGWLYEMLRPKPRQGNRGGSEPSFGGHTGNPVSRVQGILNTVAGAGEGERNNKLFWGAMRIVEMVVARELLPSEGDRAFAALASAANHAGLAEREIVRTLQSARATA